jgi:hypothetical protein
MNAFVGLLLIACLLKAGASESSCQLIFIVPLALFYAGSENLEGPLYFVPLGFVSLGIMTALIDRAEEEAYPLMQLAFVGIPLNAAGWWVWENSINLHFYQPAYILIFIMVMVGRNGSAKRNTDPHHISSFIPSRNSLA